MDTKTYGQIINELVDGKFAKLAKIAPSGSLEARKLIAGTLLYWRVTTGGKTERVQIGFYDSIAAPRSLKPTTKGYSIQAAIRKAEEFAQAHRANIANGGHRGLVEAAAEKVRHEAKAKAEEIRKTEVARLEASKFTLKNLLSDYCNHLEALNRMSYRDARSIFKIHITEAFPQIASLPANQVTGEQVADMMRRVLELQKGRTANKLRSYVRAAYQVAIGARSKASIPVHFKSYRVISNPGADTVPDEAQNKPDKNPLNITEIRSYWQIIKDMDDFKGAVLRFHLLTGGQRIEQLVNLKTCDIKGNTITLYDSKGRPGKAPRPHTVPLISLAVEALKKCNPRGTYALSISIKSTQQNDDTTTENEKHLSAITLSNWAVNAAKNIPGFATKRIRSGIETVLAGARISTEIRGRLQSHGITGVQARHYDGYDYIEEKRQALETLFKLLEKSTINDVVTLRAT